MSKANDRTKNLRREFWSVDKMDPNPENPNEMDEASFNLLYDNIEQMGITDPILVVPHPDEEKRGDGWVMIIGGEHRWEVAKLHGIEEVPVTLVEREDFDQDMQKFQIVRHNIIKGKMSPQKFMRMYHTLSKDYSESVAAEMFGFANEDEFKRLIKVTGDSLPPDLKNDFKAAAKDAKTIDDLAKILNHLLANYGDTLPFGYMIFDYGNKDSIWLRMQKGQKKHFENIVAECKKGSVTVDGVMTQILILMSKEEGEALLAKAIQMAPSVEIPDEIQVPTLDFLDEL